MPRVHLERAAARGHPAAMAALAGPPVPAVLAHLYQWALELDAVRQWDVSAAGAVPRAISYAEIDAWAQLTDRHLRPHEVQALMELDGVLRHPEETA